MSERRPAWLEAGGPRFLSGPVLISFLAWTIPFPLYVEVVVAGQPFLPWLTAGVASAFAVLPFLAIVRWHTSRRWPDGPGPWRALGVYLLAGVLRGVLLWAAVEAMGLTSSTGLVSRATISAVGSLGVMGCTSIVGARRTVHHQLMNDLADRQRELLALQSTLGERIEQTRRDLVEQVEDELAPTVAQLRSELDSLALSSDPDVESAVERFRTAVANVVRPLSRTLAERADQPTLPAPTWSGPIPQRAVEHVQMSTVIEPGVSALLVLVPLSMLAVAVAPDPYRGGSPVRAVVFSMGLWLGLKAMRWWAERRSFRPSVPVLVFALTASYVGLAVLIGSLTFAVTSGLGMPTSIFPALALALSLLASLGVSLAIMQQELAYAAEARSRDTVAELEVLTAVLRRELWRERRRLALTVHGPIQSSLVAAAVTMSRPGFTSDQVPALAATLDQAMAHINRVTGPQPPVHASARDLAALWVDSAKVTFAASAEVAAAIDANEALRAVVIEVMREGVSNAIRHGGADTVTVVITEPRSGIVRVVIEDDGDGPPLAGMPGLGSAMFTEVALTWSLKRLGPITRLQVDLGIEPIDQGREGTLHTVPMRLNP